MFCVTTLINIQLFPRPDNAFTLLLCNTLTILLHFLIYDKTSIFIALIFDCCRPYARMSIHSLYF